MVDGGYGWWGLSPFVRMLAVAAVAKEERRANMRTIDCQVLDGRTMSSCRVQCDVALEVLMISLSSCRVRIEDKAQRQMKCPPSYQNRQMMETIIVDQGH